MKLVKRARELEQKKQREAAAMERPQMEYDLSRYFYSRPIPPPALQQQLPILLIPDFCTEEEEAMVLDCLERTKWVSLRNRRVQCFGGDPQPTARTRPPLPEWLEALVKYVQHQLLKTSGDGLPSELQGINHVLVNEYKQGGGILPHTDGPMYSPVTVTLSLGPCIADMSFTTKLATQDIGNREAKEIWRHTLPTRCLVVFWGNAYTEMLHSIDNVRGNGNRRVSLTLRQILTS